MKSQQSIPTSKVARATQFVKTGVKIGGNYLKHNVKKWVDSTTSRDELHNDNAEAFIRENSGMLHPARDAAPAELL